MFNTIKKIRDVERETVKIVEMAKTKAENIRRETEENSREVYRKTYEQLIAEAKRKNEELAKKTQENAKREADKILQATQIQLEELQKKANKNFEKAVAFVVNEFVS